MLWLSYALIYLLRWTSLTIERCKWLSIERCYMRSTLLIQFVPEARSTMWYTPPGD